MEENIKNEYFELLRFESVGADPLKLRDCVNCAMWLGKWLEKEGFSVTRVPVGEDGRVSADAVLAAVTDKTVLVSVMAVCNETGARMPVEEIGRRLKTGRPGVLFHSDMVQSFLKERISLTHIDLASFSAHKIHGLKGCGALYVKKGVRLVPHVTGGGQEGGLRSGTENVHALAAFGAAAEEGARNLGARRTRILALRTYAEERLASVPGLEFLRVQGVPDVFTVFLPGYKSEVLLRFLSAKEICLSAGSACAKGKKSPVLTAMGISADRIDSALRISLDSANTEAEIDLLCEALCAGVASLVHTR